MHPNHIQIGWDLTHLYRLLSNEDGFFLHHSWGKVWMGKNCWQNLKKPHDHPCQELETWFVRFWQFFLHPSQWVFSPLIFLKSLERKMIIICPLTSKIIDKNLKEKGWIHNNPSERFSWVPWERQHCLELLWATTWYVWTHTRDPLYGQPLDQVWRVAGHKRE